MKDFQRFYDIHSVKIFCHTLFFAQSHKEHTLQTKRDNPNDFVIA